VHGKQGAARGRESVGERALWPKLASEKLGLAMSLFYRAGKRDCWRPILRHVL
jgi:hypothetical protein